jgi:iron complex transport system ATP-binding protein
VSNVSISANKLTIGYRFRTGASQPFGEAVIQADLTFSLYEGEMVCMLGPNGCGKSTLLRTLAGLQPALGGSLEIRDKSEEIRDKSEEPRAKEMALVLTERLSLESTTVHDVVALGRYPYTSFLGGLTDEDERVISEALEAVGMPQETSDTMFNAHSDGEKARILIAKALAQQTPIILLDEPTAHLDLPHRIKILRLLRQLAHEQQKTILISTHELDLAMKLSDRILLMTPGRGIQLDTAEHLREQDAFTTAFGMNIFEITNI